MSDVKFHYCQFCQLVVILNLSYEFLQQYRERFASELFRQSSTTRPDFVLRFSSLRVELTVVILGRNSIPFLTSSAQFKSPYPLTGSGNHLLVSVESVLRATPRSDLRFSFNLLVSFMWESTPTPCPPPLLLTAIFAPNLSHTNLSC